MTITFDTYPHPTCSLVESQLFSGIGHIIGMNGVEPKNICAVMMLDELRDGYLSELNRNHRRHYQKSVKLGYSAERFCYDNFIPDIVEIKTSKSFRSGGELKEHYKKTVEQSGGYPQRWKEIPVSGCKLHERNIFHGVFAPVDGYRQGSVVTNKRLLAFNGIAVCGELAIYSWNIGHGDHLKDGIMTMLTVKTVEFLLAEHPEVRYFVMGNWTDGLGVGPGLQEHKKELLFKPNFMIHG